MGKSTSSKARKPASSAKTTVLPSATSLYTLSAFDSPAGDHLALVSLAADGHKLKVWNTTTSALVADYVAKQNEKITALNWAIESVEVSLFISYLLTFNSMRSQRY